jgi:predicted nucleotidyltransferase
LKSLVVKTIGVGDVVRSALLSQADKISMAFIHGSLARGDERPGRNMDLLVVGETSFGEVVAALTAAQETLAREVNPAAYAPSEFRAKLAARQHFLVSVMRGNKSFLTGDERELARLGSKPVAHRAPKRLKK